MVTNGSIRTGRQRQNHAYIIVVPMEPIFIDVKAERSFTLCDFFWLQLRF